MHGIIYKATNKINGKIYIGQTIHSLEARRNGHYHLRRNKCRPSYFANALTKYRKDDFIWEVIDFADSHDVLDIKEKYWISFYKSNFPSFGYNLLSGGGSGRTPNAALRKILSAANKNQNNRKGQKWPEESKIYNSYIHKKIWDSLSLVKKQKQIAGLLKYRKENKFIMSDRHRKIVSENMKKLNLKGRIYSEKERKEHARVIIETRKKDKNWGKKISNGLIKYWSAPANREKAGKKNIGRKASLETRNKLRISHLGYKVSEETKKKISDTLKRKRLFKDNKEGEIK